MKDITQDVLKVFPKLTHQTKKGDNGVIGVIGGSYEYTGAPYYAAISALKIGADIVHLFCAKAAAIPIKTYTPQIIVHPVWKSSDEDDEQLCPQQLQKMQDKWVQTISKFHNRIHAWVIGPGLGRDVYMKGFFYKLIHSFPQNTLVALDADGLYFTCQYPQLIVKLSQLRTILTPNHRQFHHLNKILKLSQQKLEDEGVKKNSIVVSKEKIDANLTIIKKGESDVIITPNNKYIVGTQGGLKRCGGIGDILVGIVAVCSHWNMQIGALLSCHITKIISRKAFQKQGRSLTAPQIIEQICQTIKQLQLAHNIHPSI